MTTYFHLIGAYGVQLENFRVRAEARTLLVVDHDGTPEGENEALVNAINKIQMELYLTIFPELLDGKAKLGVDLENEATWLYLSIVPSSFNDRI